MREKQWRCNSKNNEEIYFAQYSNFYTKKCFYFAKKINSKKVWVFNIFLCQCCTEKWLLKWDLGFLHFFLLKITTVHLQVTYLYVAMYYWNNYSDVFSYNYYSTLQMFFWLQNKHHLLSSSVIMDKVTC